MVNGSGYAQEERVPPGPGQFEWHHPHGRSVLPGKLYLMRLDGTRSKLLGGAPDGSPKIETANDLLSIRRPARIDVRLTAGNRPNEKPTTLV